MPAPRQRKESIWVTLAWTLNLLGLGGIAFVGIAYVITHPTFFASAQEAQPIPPLGPHQAGRIPSGHHPRTGGPGGQENLGLDSPGLSF